MPIIITIIIMILLLLFVTVVCVFQGGVPTPCVTMAANAGEVTTRPVPVPADTRGPSASMVSRSALYSPTWAGHYFAHSLTSPSLICSPSHSLAPSLSLSRLRTHSFTHSIVCSLICSITHSIGHSLVHSLIHLLTQSPCSLTQLPTHSFTHLFTHSPICSLTCSLAHSLTCSLTHLLTYSVTHSLTCSPTSYSPRKPCLLHPSSIESCRYFHDNYVCSFYAPPTLTQPSALTFFILIYLFSSLATHCDI